MGNRTCLVRLPRSPNIPPSPTRASPFHPSNRTIHLPEILVVIPIFNFF